MATTQVTEIRLLGGSPERGLVMMVDVTVRGRVPASGESAPLIPRPQMPLQIRTGTIAVDREDRAGDGVGEDPVHPTAAPAIRRAVVGSTGVRPFSSAGVESSPTSVVTGTVIDTVPRIAARSPRRDRVRPERR